MLRKGDECITVTAGEEVPDDTMRLVLDLFSSYISNHVDSSECNNIEFPITYRLERVAVHELILQQVTCDELPLERNVFSVKDPVESIVKVYPTVQLYLLD